MSYPPLLRGGTHWNGDGEWRRATTSRHQLILGGFIELEVDVYANLERCLWLDVGKMALFPIEDKPALTSIQSIKDPGLGKKAEYLPDNLPGTGVLGRRCWHERPP